MYHHRGFKLINYLPANVVEGDTNILQTEVVEGDHANKDDGEGEDLK